MCYWLWLRALAEFCSVYSICCWLFWFKNCWSWAFWDDWPVDYYACFSCWSWFWDSAPPPFFCIFLYSCNNFFFRSSYYSWDCSWPPADVPARIFEAAPYNWFFMWTLVALLLLLLACPYAPLVALVVLPWPLPETAIAAAICWCCFWRAWSCFC